MTPRPFDFGGLILAAGLATYLGLAVAIRPAWPRWQRRGRDARGLEVLPPG